MKKVFNTISVLLLLQVAAYAQQPQNRTTATKIADVLGQQPANEKVKFLYAMNELEGFTSSDVVALLSRLKPQGQNNAEVEYATNSYSFFVNQPGKEKQKEVYVQGLLEALSTVEENTNQAFILRLLRQCAGNSAVAKVATYLNNSYLADGAARTLVTIHSQEASDALLNGLANTSDEKSAIAVVTALGDVKNQAAEQPIIALLDKYKSDIFKRTALIALSKIGGTAALPIFEKELKAANYSYDNLNGIGLGLDYAESLIDNKKNTEAIAYLNSLFAEASKLKAINAQVGSLTLLTALDAKKQKKNLLLAVQNENNTYRHVALGLLQKYGDANDTKKLLGLAAKSSPAVQESLLNYIAQNGSINQLKAIEKLVGKSTDTHAKLAGLSAINLLSKGAESKSLISNLSTDDQLNQSIKALLLSSKNENTIDEVNNALANVDDAKKIQLLDILSVRSNSNSSQAVLGLKSSNAEVNKAINNALPNVAQEKDLDVLINLLGTADEASSKNLETAIANVIQSSPNKEQHITKLAANISRSAAPSATKYFPIFARLGDQTSLTAVSNYLKSDNPALKEAAIAAIADWSTPLALNELIQLSRADLSADLNQQVFSGLVKNINKSTETNDQKTLLLKDAFAVAKSSNQKKSVLASLQSTGTYQALIFASQYMKDADLKGAAVNTAMNIALEDKSFVGAEVRNVLNEVIGNLSGSESSYLKEAVIKHLAEMPKSEGFVSLFNGQDLTGWKGLVANPIKRGQMSPKELAAAQVKADEQMRQGWSAQNGELVFNGKGDNIATIKQYGDFEMLVDWKLDKNGTDGDAGIYLRGTPQVQIWDIARVKDGAQVGSGGLYNNQKATSKPLLVADNPLGEWNTFRIKMVDDKVTVYLNGKLVTDQVPLENYWDRNQSIFPTEQIELQAHGTVVYYRDIYLKELARKQVFQLSDAEKKEGFEMLFDGTNLDKWTKSDGYVINDEGLLWVYPNAKFGGNLYTKEEYSDFVYRFDFKLTDGANNGVGVRAPLEGDAAYEGMEIQVLDNTADIYKDLKPYQYHGSVYGVVTAKKGQLKPVGEWNTEEIIVKGNRVKVTLNGVVIVDADIAEASKNGTLDGKDHPGLKRTSGHIAFLGHGSEVFFKNIRVKKLK
ncbi:DUF1080 domain-containing protein [Sphingobacterium sp. SRCM116780]|uniref:DUF1080 domain-containing protein n=1 Tax=Sphingobacterium sp. SRCM116780 TaxID=2907623 RepID=UPI001F256375|nr:family 16 glycoside hydrolase [Sphingobacterium sp. SRCM116780]UIR58000.1 DUF1080 domain-containing protein [Sphingobacterium sp. SRCM116780]